MTPASSLRDVLPPYLELIDAGLAEDSVALRERPLRAALVFAREFVTQVSEGTVEGPIGQAWFDTIHFEVLRWYHERYGPALSANPTGSAQALVSHRGVVFGLTIPLTVSRPDAQLGSKWLHFPVDVRADEDVSSFLDHPPNLRTWNETERDVLLAQVADAATAVRSLGHDLRMATLPEGTPPFAEDAFWALSRSAGGIAVDSSTSRRLAVWDLNFACELGFKAYISQQGTEPEWSHVISDLYAVAVITPAIK